MTPQNQLRPTPDGDCLRACIASLLDEKIEDVPDFTGEGTDGIDWWIKLQTWLLDRGLFFLEVRIGGTYKDGEEDKPVIAVWNPLPFACLAMLVGPTESGLMHTIVGTCEGSQFLPQFNPLPGSKGITRVDAVAFLVQRDPAILPRMGKSLERIRATALPYARKGDLAMNSILKEAREGLADDGGDEKLIIT